MGLLRVNDDYENASCALRVRRRRRRGAKKMTPWTIRLAFDIVLVDEMLGVNNSMDHPMES